jgi:hypothetical protein
MPSAFQEIMVSAMLGTVQQVGKAYLVDTLNKIKQNNTPEVFQNTLKSVNGSFKLLKEITVKTKTKIDDGFINMVLDAVTEVAEENEIPL